MRINLALLALLALLATARAAPRVPRLAPPLSGAALNASFLADGFVGGELLSYSNGTHAGRALLALSANATTLSTGRPKRALYLEGDGYSMGRLTAVAAGEDARRMADDYVDGFVLYLIAPKAVAKYGNETWFKAVEAAVADFLIAGSNKAFDPSLVPDGLLGEMRGLADGLQAAYPDRPAGYFWGRVVVLNFGIDWLSAHAFAGKLALRRALLESAVRVGAPEEAARLLREGAGLLRAPLFCDAFGRANPDGGILMGRAFQLPTCNVFNEVALTVVARPTEAGRAPTASLTAPGIVGAITSVGLGGVAAGVDTLRSAYSNLDRVGFNSVLMVRHVASTASSLDGALSVIGDAPRGCPWLYPVCAAGDGCAVVESGAFDTTPPERLDSLQWVRSKALEARLPTAAWVQKNSGSAAVWRNGTFARGFGYSYPAAAQDYNPGLFALASRPYNASAFGPAGALLFPTWQDDRNATRSLLNDYFPPPRTAPADRFVVVSNLAVVPEMRLSQMAPASDLLEVSAESVQWRYDRLAADVAARRGQALDFSDAHDLITFLSPSRTPGYWHEYYVPGEPATAQVEGAVSALDLRDPAALTISSLTGFWCDGFVQVTLNRYVQ